MCSAICGATTTRWRARRPFSHFGCPITGATSGSRPASTRSCVARRAKSVLVNNPGYRQAENVWTAAEPGRNVVLTIDVRLQQAAERALQGLRPDTRGAAVVMDVHTGDILALASSPALDPNGLSAAFTQADWQHIRDWTPRRIAPPTRTTCRARSLKPWWASRASKPGWSRIAAIPTQAIFVGRQAHSRSGQPGPVRFPARPDVFEQFLFHHDRPEGGH